MFLRYELSEEDRSKKPNIWAPHATPVMAGGLFAIRRDWFDTLGFYDEGDFFLQYFSKRELHSGKELR